jgi:hypothetical protein
VHCICINFRSLPDCHAYKLQNLIPIILEPDPQTSADTDFHLIGVFSVQTVAEAELTPDVENSSLEQVSQQPTVLCVFICVGDPDPHVFVPPGSII